MKRFYSKILTCLIPVALAAVVVAIAFHRYANGEGGFKLGVDLAGGTDLIYEMDQDKIPPNANPTELGQQLAASLKRRIDPADLYNVTIRPAGNYRVEIILPTGGEHQSVAEDRVWNDLLEKVWAQWPVKHYHVPVGRTTELLARINAQYPDEEKVPVAQIEKFIHDNYKPVNDPQKDQKAWQQLLDRAAAQYPPRHYEVARGRVPTLINLVREEKPDLPATEVEKFIDENYQVSRDQRHLTGEQVQEVKELISRVGSLEFKILANTQDDKAALDATRKYYEEASKDRKIQDELDALAVAGKPPTAPVNPDGDPTFPTTNDTVRHSYTWVELGKSERDYLGLSNEFEKDAEPNSMWKRAAEARAKHEVMALDGGMVRGHLVALEGSPLLFSRPVLNPRLSDKEADKKFEYFVLTRDPEKGKEITGKYLVDAREDASGFGLKVAFRFDQEGGNLFGELTDKNKPAGSSENPFHRYLAVVLDGKIESAPTINAVIHSEGVIEGKFTHAQVDRLVRILKAGALPASLKPQPVAEFTLGSTLGAYTVYWGTWSVLIAFFAILAFMLVYYRFAGLVACVALLANLLLTVAFMVLVNATFTLPGLAGLVLMLGMAVDANVLIYERLREERDRGASLALAIRNGYDRAFPTIIDTHLTSIFNAIVLYAVGNDQLKGFGITLTVGLAISLFTSLYMTRLMFDLWLYKGWLKKLSMFRLLSRPNIDFMAIRYYWFTATILLTVFGAAVFMYRLDRGGLDVDFIGGTAYTGTLVDYENIEQLRTDLKDTNLPDLSVEQVFVNDPTYTNGNASKLFKVSTSEKNAAVVQQAINSALGSKLKKTLMKDFSISNDNKHAVMSFVDQSGQTDFASRAQVGRLLTQEFNNAGLTSVAQDYMLEGLGAEKEGHFQWMDLQLVRPLERPKLESVLKATQSDLSQQPQPESLDNFDSQLASETQTRALYAILASWGAILLYLWFRFGNWTFGLAAVLCLIHDLFFTLGIIGFSHYIYQWSPGLANALLLHDFKINLPTVAALLTLVGYSVNDTIVVFDRIREVRGKNPLLTPQMINDSVNQTLSRTLLTAFSVWLVVIVLYILGGEGIHLFAFVMVVGVIVGTYSSIYIASPLLLIFGEGARPASLRDRKVEARAEEALT
jgi:SecD/SecF fusion protein